MTQPVDTYTSNPDQAPAPSGDPAAGTATNGGGSAPSFSSGPTPMGQMLGYAALGIGIGIGLNLLLSR